MIDNSDLIRAIRDLESMMTGVRQSREVNGYPPEGSHYRRDPVFGWMPLEPWEIQDKNSSGEGPEATMEQERNPMGDKKDKQDAEELRENMDTMVRHIGQTSQSMPD